MKQGLVVVVGLFLAQAAGAASSGRTEALDRLKKQVLADPMAAPALQKFAVDNLLPQCVNPVLVQAARAQNAKKVSLEKVQALDKEWISTSGDSPLKAGLLANEVSKELRRFSSGLAAVREAFVMDGQGAVVGETNVTTDYWQGDEKKWTESFKGGQGSVHIAAAQFDASASEVLQQISLPLLDEKGAAVGAVTWGVILEKIDWKK